MTYAFNSYILNIKKGWVFYKIVSFYRETLAFFNYDKHMPMKHILEKLILYWSCFAEYITWNLWYIRWISKNHQICSSEFVLSIRSRASLLLLKRFKMFGSSFRSYRKFNTQTGKQVKNKAKMLSYTQYFAESLLAETERDEKIVSIHAAMGGEARALTHFKNSYRRGVLMLA